MMMVLYCKSRHTQPTKKLQCLYKKDCFRVQTFFLSSPLVFFQPPESSVSSFGSLVLQVRPQYSIYIYLPCAPNIYIQLELRELQATAAGASKQKLRGLVLAESTCSHTAFSPSRLALSGSVLLCTMQVGKTLNNFSLTNCCSLYVM